MILLNIVIFTVGLILLVKGADYFTKSAAAIAKRSGISEFVIGLTLVAIATSIPELASSIVASIRHQSGLVLGNIIGSNAANAGLIVGLSAILSGISVKKRMLTRDGYIMLFVSVLFFVFAFGGLSRIEAIFFLLLYLAYVTFLFQTKPRAKEAYQFRSFLAYFLNFQYVVTIRSRIFSKKKKNHELQLQKRKEAELIKSAIIKDIFVMILSLIAIAIGAHYLIDQAIYFSKIFNVEQSLIGASLIALGTSLPELSVSLTAMKKGYGGIAFGNIVGSNISNILMVLGVSTLIYPIAVDSISLIYSIPFMIAISGSMFIFAKSNLEIKHVEGVTLLILYALFMIFLFS